MSINYLALRSSPLSTITAGVVNYSTITGSTLRANTNTVKTASIAMPAIGPTSNKISITNLNNAYIKTSDIKAELDAPVDNQQIYTFGLPQQNRWVAGGTGGTNAFAYSNDGITWTGTGTNILSAGYSVAYSGSIWAATGPAGNAYSYDGITWSLSPTASSIMGNGQAIVWGGNRFVAVSAQSSAPICYSYDGINWLASANGSSIFTASWGIGWNGSRFVACGTAGTSTLAYSADGITWYASANGSTLMGTYGSSAAWNGTIWVAVGSGTNTCIYSADGITWTASANGNSFLSSFGHFVLWNGIYFIAGGAGTNTVAYSTNGITWSGSTNAKALLGNQLTLGWNGTRCVSVGGSTTANGYSPDGNTWTAVTIPTNTTYVAANVKRLHSITFPKNLLVAGGTGSNTLSYSSDGVNWTGLGSTIFGAYGSSAAWNGYLWVAVGQCVTNTINFSYDGVSWNGLGTTIFSTAGYGIAWGGNNQWIAVGAGTNTIAYSNDGLTWIGLGTSVFSTAGYGLVWNGSIWIATGSGTTNTLAYSSNGITWTGLGTAVFSTAGNSVAWNGSRFVAVGIGANTLAWSSNGTTWNSLGSAIFSVAGFGVAWNGQRFVAVGQGTNSIAYSADGITWIGLGTSNFSVCGNGITWNNSQWIATGQGINKQSYSVDGITWTDTTPTVYLPFEGTTGDVTGTSTVTTTGTFTYNTGKVGQYAAFFNNPTVGSPTYYLSCTLPTLTNFTVTGWFNATAIAATYAQIIWGMGDSSNSWLIGINGTTGYITCNFPIPTATAYNPTTFVVSANTWYYFTYIYRQVGTCSLHINGTLIVSTTSTGATSVTASPLRVGTVPASANFGFYGYIDDLRVYNTASAFGTSPYTSLSTNNYNAPYIYLPFENSAKDAMGVSITTTTGSIAYVTGKVGTYAANFVNTAGSTPSNYLTGIWLGSPSFTITGWFNPQTINGTQQTIISAYGGALLLYINASNQLTLQIPSGSGTGNINIGTTSYTLTTNTWYSFVIIFQSNALCSLYVNNALVATYTNSGGFGTLIGALYSMGGNSYGPNLAFNGYIDDIRIYNSALSITQSSAPIYGSSLGWNGNLGSGPTPNVFIQHPTIACGTGTNSLAYSPDGIQWTGLGTTVFTTAQGTVWNGIMWLAGGSGANTVAYSYDGLKWTGLGSTIFGTSGYDFAWNGSLWVGVGQGTTTIAYSYDGINWSNVSNSTTIFNTAGYFIDWNGTQWVAGGSSSPNAVIATSTNGLVWTPSTNGSAIFTSQVNGLTWGNNLWVAVGQGTNTMAYSTNGSTWTAITGTVFTTAGNEVTWNGSRFVAVGTGTYTILTSTNGTSWSNVTTGTSLFSIGYSVCWNQTRFVAGGTTALLGVTPGVYCPFDNSVSDVQGGITSQYVITNGWFSDTSHLTLYPGTITYSQGIVGNYAISCSLAGSIVANYTFNTTAFTVAFWVYPTAWPNTVFTLYGQVLTALTGQPYFGVYVNGSNQLYILVGGVTTYTGTNTTVNLNKWSHITLVYASNTLSVYVNGVVSNISISITISSALSYGLGFCYSAPYTFVGSLDDFRIYNSALSATQIAALYTNPFSSTAYSPDGLNWYPSPGTSVVATTTNGVASNPRIGAVVVDSQLTLNKTGVNASNKLDIVSDTYYQNGCTEFSANITVHNTF